MPLAAWSFSSDELVSLALGPRNRAMVRGVMDRLVERAWSTGKASYIVCDFLLSRIWFSPEDYWLNILLCGLLFSGDLGVTTLLKAGSTYRGISGVIVADEVNWSRHRQSNLPTPKSSGDLERPKGAPNQMDLFLICMISCCVQRRSWGMVTAWGHNLSEGPGGQQGHWCLACLCSLAKWLLVSGSSQNWGKAEDLATDWCVSSIYEDMLIIFWPRTAHSLSLWLKRDISLLDLCSSMTPAHRISSVQGDLRLFRRSTNCSAGQMNWLRP